MNARTRRAGTPTGGPQSRVGSGERAGARESIYESGTQESRKTAFDALQFFEGVAEVIEDIARQQRLLALVAVKNCDLRCAAA
jgi:hypothetical protein